MLRMGATPLKTATVDAAVLLGIDDKLGYLKPGHLADIAAVEGNPLDEINATIYHVSWVMKGGTVVVDKTKAK